MKDLLLALEPLSVEQLDQVVERIKQIKIERHSQFSPDHLKDLIKQTDNATWVQLHYTKDYWMDDPRKVRKTEFVDDMYCYLERIIMAEIKVNDKGKKFLYLTLQS